MAVTLVEHLAAEWKPEKYTDDYRENLMRLIKAKMKGRKATLVEEERPREANVIDLMERLKQSLEKTRGKRGRPARGARRVARKRSSGRHAA
jgi:DNA end-binding protein Ku